MSDSPARPSNSNKGSSLSLNKRARTSPEQTSRSSKKVQIDNSMEVQQFLNAPHFTSLITDMMASLLDVKLAPIATKENIESLKNEILLLKQENDELKLQLSSMKKKYDDKFEELEVSLRKNNLILRGLNHHSKDCEKTVTTFFSDVLKIELQENTIEAFPVGPK